MTYYFQTQGVPPVPNAAPKATTGADPTPPPAASGGGSSMYSLLLPVAIFAIFYFLFIAPQSRKQKELQNKMKIGDRIVTTTGIIGKLIEISATRAVIEIAPNVKVNMLRTAIDRIDDDAPPAKDGKLPPKADAKSESKSETKSESKSDKPEKKS